MTVFCTLGETGYLSHQSFFLILHFLPTCEFSKNNAYKGVEGWSGVGWGEPVKFTEARLSGRGPGPRLCYIFFDVFLTVLLSIFISVFNQLDAQNLFYNNFYFMPLHVSSTCARNMQRHEIKLIVKEILCIKLVKY